MSKNHLTQRIQHPQPDDRAHRNRDAKLIQDHFSRGWHFEAHGPSLTGAIQREIFDAYIEAEFALDWAQAEAIHGDAVCLDLLARTDAQRRYDAFHQMCLDAASNPNTSTGSKIVHNIVWDYATFEEMVARLGGAEPKPLDPDTFRCSTIDGHRIDPHEAIIDAITNQIRRVVVDAKNVVIDMGQARFFTGLARLASRITHDECEWIGCHAPPGANRDRRGFSSDSLRALASNADYPFSVDGTTGSKRRATPSTATPTAPSTSSPQEARPSAE